MACALHRGGELQQSVYHAYHPAHRRLRKKLDSPAGRALYRRRKALVEPVIGILKEQRGMRRFRMRGLSKVAAQFALARDRVEPHAHVAAYATRKPLGVVQSQTRRAYDLGWKNK